MASPSKPLVEKNGQKNRLPLVLASICGSVAVATLVIAYPFIKPAFRKICLPYVPATDEQVKNVSLALSRLNLNPKQSSVIDLGSGDGRLVLTASKLGYNATGIELNPWLVYWSRLKSKMERLPATFIRGDLFNVPLYKYDVVIIFGVDSLMSALEEKLINESSKFNIIACRFPLPTAQVETSIGEGIDTVWLYKVPLKKGIKKE